MKKLLSEAFRIFKKAPIFIAVILLMDIAMAIICIVTPYVIGICIDNLLDRQYFGLFILIALQSLLIILRVVDKILDTRVYSRIIEEESTTYYEKIIRTDASESKISSLLDLVDDIPNFLEVDLFELLSMIGGIVFSLIFLFSAAGLLVFVLAIAVSVIVPLATYRFQRDIAVNNKELKNMDEKRVEIIAGRRSGRYKAHITKALSLGISNSDLDARICFFTDLLQTFLLVIAVLLTIHVGDYTSGQLFSIITYVMMLNDYVDEINKTIIMINDLKDTVSRLEKNTK